MESFDRKKHWENIYQTKDPNNVSWYQDIPITSLEFLKEFNIPTDAEIIDIGGGNSFFVDNLLDLGYQNITVLDISETAIELTKKRLGNKASKVHWVISDVSEFKPEKKYDFWHDRATFHFLTKEQEISDYINTVQQYLTPKGVLVLGTFSEQGPEKCSGIEIKQYSESSMTASLKKFFNKIKCLTVDHKTPFGTIQNFIFCSFRKKMLFA